MTDPVLEVRDLHVSVGATEVIHGIDFTLEAGQRTGLIGESGSGKTLTALAIMGLLPDGLLSSGSVVYRGRDLLHMDERDLCKLRGNRLAMIFQEPMLVMLLTAVVLLVNFLVDLTYRLLDPRIRATA